MQITQRDISMFMFIDNFGYVSAQHIAIMYNMSLKSAYKRLNSLVKNGYLQHIRIFHRKHGVYLCTAKALSLIPYPASIARINLGTYKHNLLLVDLLLALSNEYNCTYKTDRIIRREQGFSLNPSSRPHFPDAVLSISGNNIAVELELTEKGAARLNRILKYYIRSTLYSEVWYFVSSPALAHKIQNKTIKMPFIKVQLLSEVLSDVKAAR
ncbi:MAG: hypothetical protein K6T65_10620 [Peptococcaceae bacterium]|nr:hypothetical protein [Peptococcaceae bacterium]